MNKYFLFISICIASNPVDKWIGDHTDILKDDIKSVSFQLCIDSELFNTPKDSVISGKITEPTGIHKKK